jgi:hypothetical protein
MKMTVFLDVASYSLIEIDQYFRGAYCLRHQGYEMSIRFHQTAQRSIPEDGHLQLTCGSKKRLTLNCINLTKEELFGNTTRKLYKKSFKVVCSAFMLKDCGL